MGRRPWRQALQGRHGVPLLPLLLLQLRPEAQEGRPGDGKGLKEGDVSFGILGEKEVCCGESIRKTGNEELFKKLAKENIKAFIDAGSKRYLSPRPIATIRSRTSTPSSRCASRSSTSPSSSRAHKRREAYALRRVREEGRLPRPVLLGPPQPDLRRPPRDIEEVPGVELTELPEARMDSTCCGMGGGRVWAETEKHERFSNIRVDQALEKGPRRSLPPAPTASRRSKTRGLLRTMRTT